MDMLAVFNYNQSEVRTITINNEPWFVAQDVCNILELENVSKALSRLDDDEKTELDRESILTLSDDPNTVRLSAISESGLYSLVLSSRKPEAKPFKRWIAHDVIPSIRKTGKYEIDQKPKTALELAKEQVKLLEQLELQQQIIDNQEKDLLRQSEVIDELFDYSSIIRIAKFNNVPETIFKWQTLKAASQKMNLEVKTAPCPRYVTKNLYSHDAWRFCYPSIKLPETTTLVIKHS